MPRKKKTAEPELSNDAANAVPVIPDEATTSANEESKAKKGGKTVSATEKASKPPKKAGKRKAPEAPAKKVSRTRKQSKPKEQKPSSQSEIVSDSEKPIEVPTAGEVVAEEARTLSTNDAIQAEMTQTDAPVVEEKDESVAKEQAEADDTTGKKPRKQIGKKTESAPTKAAAAQKRTARKMSVPSLNPVLILQFQGNETDTTDLIEAAKADFKAQHKRTPITDLKLYLKPEERAAYYVANGSYNGKITY